MIGILGCLLGFIIVIFLVYKNFSPFIASIIGAIFVVLVNGLSLTESLTGIYFPKLAGFVSGYFGIFLFGAILARIYADSGAAVSVADKIMSVLLKDDASENKRQITAIVIVMLMTGILGMGGIITSVAVIIVYPLALSVLEKANIPKRFSFAALALGAYTWVCNLPGSPQVTNLVPMSQLGTTATAGLVPGIVGCIIEIVLMVFILNKMVTKAKKNGEYFAYGPKDVIYDSQKDKPNAYVALIPLVLLFSTFNFLKMDINLSLLISCALSVALFWKFLKEDSVLSTLNNGAVNALAPMCTVGAIVGFANIITSTESFKIMVDMIFNGLDVGPIPLVMIFCGLIAALTGGSATGFLVSLPIITPVLVDQMGLSPAIIHRLGLFIGTSVSLLPYSGVILMFLPLADVKLKDIYAPVFATCVVGGIIASIVVAVMFAVFPGMA